MKKLILMILSLFIISTTSLAFYDTNECYWAKDAINKWSNMGYISGYPNGNFKGNSYITRAEVVSVVAKLDNSKINTEKKPGKDVNNYDWFFEDMARVASLGLISADKDGNIRPNDFATREETAVILSNLLNISYSGNLENAKINKYLDKGEIDSDNYRKFAGMVEEGFINGYEDNTLKPKGRITRAEFVSILNNSINYIYSSGSYDGEAIVGNVLINGENVKIYNSEILGNIFVTNGVKENPPEIINTMVSKGVKSKVGNIIIKDDIEQQTLSQYNEDYPEEYNKAIFATLKYSETDWTNKEVTIKVSFDDEDVNSINLTNDKLKVDKNGNYEIKYTINGKVHSIFANVNNIDKDSPEVAVEVQQATGSSTIKLNIKDDGLSPIKKITFNGNIYEKDKETGLICTEFVVTSEGTYKLEVEDEAGNIAKKDIIINEISRLPYKVEYNANGGSNAPNSQEKIHKIDLVLTSAEPTYTGYIFKGWNTKADGSGISYASGAIYSIDEEVILYAQWEIII